MIQVISPSSSGLSSISPFPLIESVAWPNGSPFDVYARLTGGAPHSFLLESGEGNSGLGRYSFIGSDPYLIFRAKGETGEVWRARSLPVPVENPVESLFHLVSRHSLEYGSPLPPFLGGAVGYFGYDLVRQFETLPLTAEDDLQVPDLYFLFVETLAVIDHEQGCLHLVFTPNPDRLQEESRQDLYREGRDRLARMRETLFRPERNAGNLNQPDWQWAVSAEQSPGEYMDRVRACQDLIAAGEIYQANLSHRFAVDLSMASSKPAGWSGGMDSPGACFYRRIRRLNPSPFSAYLVLEDCTVVCNSPERLVRVQGQRVETRPIAGTRPRGRDVAEDRRLVEALLASPKERAEHLMLVDLARNDLGRVCRYGTVSVDQFMTVERYSHVAHLVSNVSGLLQEGVGLGEVVRAVFPGGTITGVPKVHCMEIIDRLEPVRRALYTGSIGYIGWNGAMDMNILIRTLLLVKGRGYLQVGGGIVADSDPRQEYEETVHKAQAFLQVMADR